MKLYTFSERALRLRWLLMAILGVLIIVYELTKHGLDDLRNPEFDLILELLLMGVVMPLMGGYLLTKLALSRASSERYKSHLDQYKDLFQELAKQRELKEYIKFLLKYPSVFLPVQRASLFLYDHRQARLEPAADWNIQGEVLTPSQSPEPQICRTCLSSSARPVHPSVQCPFVQHNSHDQSISDGDFCFALSYNKILIGTLQLTCQPGKTISPEQIEFMNFIMPEMALTLAIAIANPRQIAHVRLQTQFMERQQAAIDLHNTLAQQIGFLHLSLDRLAMDDRLGLDNCIRDELEHMRLTAADVYQHIRNSLAGLQLVEPVDLTQTIVDYSFKVAQRAHLSNGFTTAGYPVPLPLELRRQIFSIFQEGLNNVEKYAHARHLQISVIWTEDCLNIGIEDDGMGFEPSLVQTDGHYGLTMMRELVKNMEGQFAIDSSHGRGTVLNFSIPLSFVQANPVSSAAWPIESYALVNQSPQTE